MRTPDAEPPPERSVVVEALEVLARPRVWLSFTVIFAGLVALLLLLAQGAGAPLQRFDYDLF